jgi:threonine/homoserine/homoserine lactone efflux protein
MELSYLVKGMVIGFALAAPIGPVGLLCIRRTLAHGRQVGFYTGLGAATGDATLGAVAAFGLTAVAGAYAQERMWVGLLGGVFLCGLGVRMFLTKANEPAPLAGNRGFAATYFSTLAITLTNPATIAACVAIFAAFGLGAGGNYRTAAELVAGMFLGSTLWWVILSSGVGALRARVNTRLLQTVNRVIGGLLIAFGVYVLKAV